MTRPLPRSTSLSHGSRCKLKIPAEWPWLDGHRPQGGWDAPDRELPGFRCSQISRTHDCDTFETASCQSWSARSRPGRRCSAHRLLTTLCALALLFSSAGRAVAESADSRADSDDRSADTESTTAAQPGETATVGADDTSSGDATRDELPWLDSLAKGYAEAGRQRQPILVRVGGASCPFCRLLASEMKKADVQAELSRWTLVDVDADKSPDDARLLAVAAIPALRLLTPGGKLVASRDGYLDAGALAAWLQKHHPAAAASPAQQLTDEHPPSIVDVVRLVREFEQRDAALREAAVRRLKPYPAIAAVPVVASFKKGSLSTRLTALELLNEWGAPAGELDPWVPETLTEARLDVLSKWASSPDLQDSEAAGDEMPLSDEALADARRLIERMIAADVVEARAIRERLARLGKTLMPEIHAQLKTVETDRARQRLTALRYRLVASDALVLNWPGGLDRLSATDLQLRQQAADELADLAAPADEPLLLELFSDPAPLVREISLRALQEVGGSDANSALVGLLDDPEPNVRAAVLKQLTESPSEGIVPKIAEYVAGEQDADLVVHAVRLLSETSGKPAVACLMTLLKHESWRVRAEAAEAIGKSIERQFSSEQAFKADAYVSLIELLEDEDSFVVSRAILSLSDADLVTAVDPLAAVADKHPELAGEVVKALSTGRDKGIKAIPHLKRFCTHDSASVRAAAITGLCHFDPADVDQPLRAALKDDFSEVRIAAAEALFEMLENRRHSGRLTGSVDVLDSSGIDAESFTIDTSPPRGGLSRLITSAVESLFGKKTPSGNVQTSGNRESKNAEADDIESEVELPAKAAAEESEESVIESDDANEPDAGDRPEAKPDETIESERQLLSIRAGKVFPEWMHQTAELLQPMLAADSIEERFAGAAALAALGHDAEALPVIEQVLESPEPHVRFKPADVLPWLLWDDRLALFNKLVDSASDVDQLATIADALIEVEDKRALDPLWMLASREDAGKELAGVLVGVLRGVYFPDNRYYPKEAPLSRRKRAAADLIPRAESGPMWQRLVALVMLLDADPDEAARMSKRIVDESADGELSADAFEILLKAESSTESKRTAVAALSSEIPRVRKRALAYLATDERSLSFFDDEMSWAYDWRYGNRTGGGKPIIPEPPDGLNTELLEPFRNSNDPEFAAYVQYFLILFDETDDLAPLIAYWQDGRKSNSGWTKLVYRAIAYLDDATQVPLLEEIYEKHIDKHSYDSDVGDFYWTIRIMTGPRVLALRKKIRNEVGMDQLRR